MRETAAFENWAGAEVRPVSADTVREAAQHVRQALADLDAAQRRGEVPAGQYAELRGLLTSAARNVQFAIEEGQAGRRVWSAMIGTAVRAPDHVRAELRKAGELRRRATPARQTPVAQLRGELETLERKARLAELEALERKTRLAQIQAQDRR